MGDPAEFHEWELEDIPTLGEWARKASAETKWLVKGIIPEKSMVILSGDAKAGKSLFLRAMFVASHFGREFLGAVPNVRPFLISEGTPEEFKQYLVNSLKVSEQEFCRLRWPIFDELFLEEHQLYAARLIEGLDHSLGRFKAKNKPNLLVFDTFMFSLDIRDINNNSEVVRALRPLRTLIEKHNVSAILVHHPTNDRENLVAGANKLRATADDIILFSEGKGTTRKLTMRGRFVGRESLEIQFDREKGSYTNSQVVDEEGNISVDASTSTGDMILSIMVGEGGVWSANRLKSIVEDRFGLSLKLPNISDHLARLVKDDKVEKVKRGRYAAI